MITTASLAPAERRRGAPVTLRRDGDVARIELDDGRGNALGRATLAALGDAVAEASSADAVLLVGRKRIFCGGLDLDEVLPLPREELLEFLDVLYRTRRALFALPRPLVVAVAGSAIGAGAALLCCGDARLGARDAGLVGFPEVGLGVPLPSSGLQICKATFSQEVTARVLLFGESFGRDEALAMGFFHRLVEPGSLLEDAERTARAAAGISTASRSIKSALRREALQRMDEERAESHEAFADAWTSPAAQARIAAVLKSLGRSR
ncbi:MAG: enoyl-CoA hydratase/isomerase family protein [Byssovorax sp.]